MAIQNNNADYELIKSSLTITELTPARLLCSVQVEDRESGQVDNLDLSKFEDETVFDVLKAAMEHVGHKDGKVQLEFDVKKIASESRAFYNQIIKLYSENL